MKLFQIVKEWEMISDKRFWICFYWERYFKIKDTVFKNPQIAFGINIWDNMIKYSDYKFKSYSRQMALYSWRQFYFKYK